MDPDSFLMYEESQPKRTRTDEYVTSNDNNQEHQQTTVHSHSLTATIRNQQQELQRENHQIHQQQQLQQLLHHQRTHQLNEFDYPLLQQPPTPQTFQTPVSANTGPYNRVILKSSARNANNETPNVSSSTQQKHLLSTKKSLPQAPAVSSSTDPTSNTSHIQPNASTAVKNNSPPPPIVAYDIDTKKVADEFRKLLGHSNFDINTKNTRCSHIRTRTRKDYDIVVSAIANMQIEYHLYTPYEDRVINIVLRGVCSTFNGNDIETAINDLKLDIVLHNVQKYETVKSRREGHDLRLWLIQLKPGSNVAELLRQRRLLCHNDVVFERRKDHETIQCKNCQHFGHIARNCSRHFRCVKCLDKHNPGACPTDELPPEDINRRKPICVNCGKAHPANYRGCQAHIDLIKLKQARVKLLADQQHFRQHSANSFRSPDVNFSQAVRNESSNRQRQPKPAPPTDFNNPNEENCLNFLQRECNSVLGTDLFTILRQIKSFAPKYRSLRGEQKQQALIEFILSISPI